MNQLRRSQIKSLLLVEPWICHYELLPSVIDSTLNLYECYHLFTPDRTGAYNAISHLKSKAKIELHQNLKIDSLHSQSYYDIWLNTTHQHGSQESYKQSQRLLIHLIHKLKIENILCVIHNQIDQKWFIDTKESTKDMNSQCNLSPVYLSNHSAKAYPTDSIQQQLIFKPYTLNKVKKENDYAYPQKEKALKLSIVGMCRAGKRFSELYRFKELIKAGIIEINFVGWSPFATRRVSGINNAISCGYLSDTLMSENRLPDIKVSAFLKNSHALIDLKVIDDHSSSGISSGNIGLSRALQIPLIAHKNHYPDFSCIRYKNYDELIVLFKESTKIISMLNQERNKLISKQQNYRDEARKLFER